MLKKNVIRAFLITVFLCCCSYGFFLNIGGWLTTSDVPAQVDAVICLDGSSDRINKAVLLLQKGFAEKVVVTTEGAYKEMLLKKISPEKILKADWSASTTYEEGLLAKDILYENIKSAIVVTDPFHLFRVRWTFQHIFFGGSVAFSFVSS